MELLKNLIVTEGRIVSNKLVKVDNFLNHQIDSNLMFEMGKEFKERFSKKEVTKILTIEASGIALGVPVAHEFRVPLVFAKKQKPATMENFYTSKVKSFTKGVEYDICVSKDFIKKGDKILIVDDFLAMGAAVFGLKEIIDQAGAELVGVGIAIEKGFQEGGKLIREQGIDLVSLAIIEKFEDGKIIFR